MRHVRVPVPHAAADYVRTAHPTWWATIDRPVVDPGDRVEFVDTMSGAAVAWGVVDAVVRPGVFHADATFTDWWRIVFTPSAPLQIRPIPGIICLLSKCEGRGARTPRESGDGNRSTGT